MEQLKRRRAENWSSEEKELLRQVITHSVDILENKSTTTAANLLKAKEWRSVMKKLNELSGKSRTCQEVKLAWKRMKLLAKADLRACKQKQFRIGGDEIPQLQEARPEVLCVAKTTNKRIKTIKKYPQNISKTVTRQIAESNMHFKKKQMEMLEEEHLYNIKIAKLKVKKLELEIALLENNKIPQ